MVPDISDEKIIQQFFERSEDAIKNADRKYGRYCGRIAFQILCDEGDMEECLNDTWLHAWNAIPPTRPDILSAFLGKITRNLALNMYKSRSAKKRTGDRISACLDELNECMSLSSDNVTEFLDKHMLGEAINRFLDGVPEKQRKIFVRRYFYLDTIDEISKLCKMNKSYVKVTLHRLRKSLKRKLEEEGFY